MLDGEAERIQSARTLEFFTISQLLRAGPWSVVSPRTLSCRAGSSEISSAHRSRPENRVPSGRNAVTRIDSANQSPIGRFESLPFIFGCSGGAANCLPFLSYRAACGGY